ncbi:MAG: RagB/SusD family nutrient uptake outer membrane protein [Odoribacter sp.]|nr:RagB/SusD family nutrient uptake outer membrane protein [Odoribacter sp.]
MKKYISLFVAILCGCCFSACDLDTLPTTQVDEDLIYGRTEDVDKVLNGAWGKLMETFYTYANPGFGALLRISDAMGSDAVLDPNKYGFASHYQFRTMNDKSTGSVSHCWNRMYDMINNCNNVIAKVDASVGDDEEKQRIKGQAYALRGWMYMTLASLYSYAIDKDPDALCVPVYTTPTVPGVTGNKRESVSVVYDRAIKDLEEAKELIPENYNRSSKHKVNRQVIYGLLARTNLYARHWAEAESYAALAHGNAALMSAEEYKGGFNEVSNVEWIWGHPQTNDQSNASYNFAYLDAQNGDWYQSFCCDPWFMELFDDGEYRKELFEIRKSDKKYLTYYKFKFRTGELGDLVLMRTSEMYLIEAEAKARQGKNDALTVLNAFKQARGAQALDAAATPEEVIEAVLIERRKELFGEGFALVDIIRNQKSVERKPYNDGELTLNGEPLKVNGHHVTQFPDKTPFVPNSPYYIFSIPLAEENNNPNLNAK